MELGIYLKPILSACYVFPFLAALFTLPYIIFQYRKYGSILLLRVAIVYTFIFYMMTSYFMTILPLPPIDSVTPDTASVLLTPFDALRNWVDTSGIVFSDPSTYFSSLKNEYFLQIFFNILLIFPFGVYLRYYFNRKWYQVIILSFLYSLFFEMTQLSGLYGIYPYPYRYFEVDDLICNTLGGFIGYICTPLLLFMLPDRKRLDDMSYDKGTHVSIFRRMIALAFDSVIIGICYLFLIKKTALSDVIPSYTHGLIIPFIAFIYFTITTVIFSGYTLGKFIVKIRIVNEDNMKAPFHMLVIRNAILYLLLLPSLIYSTTLINYMESISNSRLQLAAIICISILLAIAAYFALNILSCFVRRKVQFGYDRICHLMVVSTIKN